MAHVFISYVMENAKLAAWVAEQLRANGLDPWFSQEPGRITPGDEWQRVLRTAIQEGGYYLPIFTREWADRDRSVANQELMLAAEEARLRPPGRRWMLPIKADLEQLPPVDLGGGRQLSDIQYVDVPQLGWEHSLRLLLLAMGVSNPVLDKGEPLAPGFGANARVAGGFVTYRNFNIPVPEMDGTSFVVTGGYISRSENGSLIANFRLRAPFEGLQAINAELGLDSIDVASDDKVISTDPARPSRFHYIDEKDARAPGMPLWMMGLQEPVRTSVSIEQVTGYEAAGYLNADDQIVGTFKGFVETASVIGCVRVTFDGDFNVQLKEVMVPPI
ncbi:toll/interleukin-1 receptor domain-containing protein [Sphingobium phenoxybenzoativorans]|uniref:Toll/interleukin-1 receptor domain-containing protein n=1 Tax=Sphingobium phenoxybenzoativorans TaxID=1592790 RepID=A0A975Q160_9SPHN|nr:toll/interleukin-1 receptor domain-containing protein [Sphingobium phenoxybenzoativorans]QUT05083.1 toll/interleukin-1 receptor domain-containing protein [Sphingobium phenoxybenzoativorans]